MMIARLFCGFLLAATLCVPALAQIPNAGFENWTLGNPDGWATSNITGFANVTQATVAHSGLSAVRGEVIQFFTITLQPLIQVGPEGEGFAYNQRPASVRGYYQFFPQGGDRFAVNVGLFRGGIGGIHVGIAALAISPGASSYTQFNAPFTYLTGDIPDTCILQFQIVGPDTVTPPHVGSYFLLDDLGFSGSSAVTDQGGVKPTAFELLQNYPNPFNPSTTIDYRVPNKGYLTLKVFDVLGRQVAVLVDGVQEPGYKSVRWNAEGLASGVYIYRLSVSPAETGDGRAGEFEMTKKLLLLR